MCLKAILPPPEEPVIILESQPKVSPHEMTNYPTLVPQVFSLRESDSFDSDMSLGSVEERHIPLV